jgi:carbon-monoxide dehydrogenase catalytic subunit
MEIPNIINPGVHGFSMEYINYMLGGSFRGSYKPLNENIINGRIRGVAGVVGCTNPRVKQDWVHVELVKELIQKRCSGGADRMFSDRPGKGRFV